MVTIAAVRKGARYGSGALVLLFLINLLLDSGSIPFVQQEPFFGNVTQFLTLLVASALIALEFILVDNLENSSSASETETP